MVIRSVCTIKHMPVIIIFFLWTGLRDPIACSLLNGGSPPQNCGYMITRLCPFIFRLFIFPSSKDGPGPPSPPSKSHPGSLPSSPIFPHPLSLPLLPPIHPFLFSRPFTSSSAGCHPLSVRRKSTAFQLTAGQCHAPGFLSSVPTYESFPPNLCGW